MSNRLNIGCGKCYLPGWINIDLFSNVKADAYADMTSLPYANESFDLIYASHVLEHQHRHMIVATLNHWYSLLRPGGILRLAVPNFAAICQWYMEGKQNQENEVLDDLIGLLYGGQNSHLNRHTITFDAATLERDMNRSGFKDVKWWDWRLTDHSQHDDYSQAYLPKLEKQDGLLMSLNLEGIK